MEKDQDKIEEGRTETGGVKGELLEYPVVSSSTCTSTNAGLSRYLGRHMTYLRGN